MTTEIKIMYIATIFPTIGQPQKIGIATNYRVEAADYVVDLAGGGCLVVNRANVLAMAFDPLPQPAATPAKLRVVSADDEPQEIVQTPLS